MHHKKDNLIKMSRFAKFTRFLISINLIPVYKTNSGTIRFSWISIRTVLFLIGAYVPFGVIVFYIFIVGNEFWTDYWEKSTQIYLKFEVLIISIAPIFFFLSSPLHVLCLCRPLAEMQEITMDKSLKFLNKYDLLHLIPVDIIALGFVVFIYAYYMEVCTAVESATTDQCFTITFLVPFFLICCSILFCVIAYFMVLVWVQRIEEIFKQKNVANKIIWAENCTKLYKQLELYMGPYFFVCITQSQIIWTILCFLAMSLAISNNGFSTMSVLMHSLGMSTNNKVFVTHTMNIYLTFRTVIIFFCLFNLVESNNIPY